MTRGILSGGAGEIFYADLKVTEVIFANEWDKQLLLTSIDGVKKLFCAELYAFCVLDDRLRLLLGGPRLKAVTVRLFLATLMERYLRSTEQIRERDVIPRDAGVSACILRIEDEQDAMQVLRYIHLTPSSEGYSLFAAAYWWTSYSTYRGRYCWPVVDAESVMRVLERQDRQAARSLLDFHRRAEAMQNPLPCCLRFGTFRTLDWRKDYIPQAISEEKINETFGA